MADLNQAQLLAGSSLPNGQAIVLTADYQTLHVAVNNTVEWDVITLFANHKGGGSHDVLVSWGGVELRVNIASESIELILDKWRMNSGLELQMKADPSTSDMVAYLTVDRYPAGLNQPSSPRTEQAPSNGRRVLIPIRPEPFPGPE